METEGAERAGLFADLLERPALELDGGPRYSWRQVIAMAQAAGWWQPVAERAHALAHWPKVQADATAVRAFKHEFRYSRKLLAGEELLAWLAHRGLTMRQWNAWAVARATAGSDQIAAGHEIEGDQLWQWTMVEAICSGALAQWAKDLAARAAARAAVGESAPASSADDAGVLEECFQRFVRQAPTDAAIRRLVADRALDWLWVEYEELHVRAQAVAEEAAHCAHIDGMALAELTAATGGVLHRRAQRIEQVRDGLSELLLSARTGEVIGPLPIPEGFRLVHLLSKRAASPDVPADREHAARTAVEQAIAAEVARRVRWHDRL